MGYFFAAEAMARDVASRGLSQEAGALRELEMEIHGAWEEEFNLRHGSASADGRISGLVKAVTDEAAKMAPSRHLNLKPAHRRGMVHRLVEFARAGWVVHWREFAGSFSGPAAGDVLQKAGHFHAPTDDTDAGS